MSYEGLCKPKNIDKAIELWSSAFYGDDHRLRWEAFARLSQLYEKGIGVPQNIDLANEYADIAVKLLGVVKHTPTYIAPLIFSNPDFIDIGSSMWDRNIEERMMEFIPDLTGPWPLGETLKNKQGELRTLLEGQSEVLLSIAIAEKEKIDAGPIHLRLAEKYIDLAADKGNAEAHFLRAEWLATPSFREFHLRQHSFLFNGHKQDRAKLEDLYIDCQITEALEYAATDGHAKAIKWLERKLDKKEPTTEVESRHREAAHQLLILWSEQDTDGDRQIMSENGPLAYLHPSYIEYQGCF